MNSQARHRACNAVIKELNMHPHFGGGRCPYCTNPLLQEASEQLKLEVCLRCGFAFGVGFGADVEGEEPEHFADQWFYAWQLLFQTYAVTSRAELRARLAEMGITTRSADDPLPPPSRRTLFNYQLGSITGILAAIGCAVRHASAPCDYCARFASAPLAAALLSDLGRGTRI
jgi:hypothetical protein